MRGIGETAVVRGRHLDAGQNEVAQSPHRARFSRKFHFSAYHDDGAQFATIRGENPLEMTIGDRKRIDCFEQRYWYRCSSITHLPCDGTSSKVMLYEF
jgi:hypothetical protein